ncbi:hypothetical protein CDAR_115141 [Caerostris darwini]|uniref:Uncharacterized protein n=1 Tax=Caerostris darwini TaxID=1538125 RepID=A0AAV4UI92_9ARAC|nr:hypothetical protein CDAR_115141 [Caerostris darwini]
MYKAPQWRREIAERSTINRLIGPSLLQWEDANSKAPSSYALELFRVQFAHDTTIKELKALFKTTRKKLSLSLSSIMCLKFNSQNRNLQSLRVGFWKIGGNQRVYF